MERYQVIQNIGKGSFGIVQKIKRLSDEKILVWKVIKYETMTSREKQQLVTQVNLLKSLDHPNIVKYYDRIIDRKTSTVYIIMEYCSGGDLGTQLKIFKKNNQFLSQDIIWKICYQLILALDYCHSRPISEEGGKILHRDIKPANIFIDGNNHIRLGDFGLSREMGQHSEFAQTHVGTPYYMSPQQVKSEKYNEKSDIWSAGCLLYEMAKLSRPFEASNQLALASKISTGKYDRIPYRYSEDLFLLIKNMLNVNVEERWNANRILTETKLFVMRKNQNLLKERIAALRERETALKIRERELQEKKKGKQIEDRKERETEEKRKQREFDDKKKRDRDVQDIKKNIIYSKEIDPVFLRKKSSREGDKQNRNRQNY